MRIFGPREAKHFCSGYTPTPQGQGVTPEQFDRAYLSVNQEIVEGTQEYEDLRCCLLEDAERSLFWAASHYRRALGLLLPSGAPWAHVTLYYGAWHAAHALVQMFGGAVLYRRWIEVDKRNPGNQVLVVRKKPKDAARSSHKDFWHRFYLATAGLAPRLDPELATAVRPIANDRAWLIERRNEVNYDTIEATQVGIAFGKSYDATTFPRSLPGNLGTQYQVTDRLLRIAFEYANDLGLFTAGLDGLTGGAIPVKKAVERYVYHTPVTSVITRTHKREICY